MLFGTELLDDVGEKVLDGFGFGFSGYDECIILDRGVGFRSDEVEYGIVVSEEIDLIDSQLLSVHFFNDVFDDFVISSLYKKDSLLVVLKQL